MGAQHIDNLTQVPEELFSELLMAGKRARARGQHQLARSKFGDQKLSLTDKHSKQLSSSSSKSQQQAGSAQRARNENVKRENCDESTWWKKKEGNSEKQSSAALFVSNGCANSLTKKAIGEKLNADFFCKDVPFDSASLVRSYLPARKPYTHEVKSFNSSTSHSRSCSAGAVSNELPRIAGSGFRAASGLKKGRTSSVPIKSNGR